VALRKQMCRQRSFFLLHRPPIRNLAAGPGSRILMSVLYIYLFGKFDAYYGELALSGLDGGKAQELLCYLLLNRDRPHSREVLAELLWNNSSSAQSKAYLRKALWQLQSAFDAQAERLSERVLLVESDWVQLNPAADLYLDVAAFERAFLQSQGVRGRELDSRTAQILQAAVDLYRGDLLEGWYQDWCIHERERLRHLYLAMLDKLMGYCEVCGDFEAGLIYGSRILQCDRARERTHRRLMRLRHLAGDRTGALRQYERCVAALDEELGVEPSRRTIGLYQQIRADRLSAPALEVVSAAEVSEEETPALPEVLDRLRGFQVLLAEAQNRVQQDIQAVERALRRR
jgi:DNA-binding SARP family transcriptional activator